MNGLVRHNRPEVCCFFEVYFCAPARNRTQINGSEDRCVIRYTTGALFNFGTFVQFG